MCGDDIPLQHFALAVSTVLICHRQANYDARRSDGLSLVQGLGYFATAAGVFPLRLTNRACVRALNRAIKRVADQLSWPLTKSYLCHILTSVASHSHGRRNLFNVFE